MAARQWRVLTACNVVKVDTVSVHLCPITAMIGDTRTNAVSAICMMMTTMVATENDAAVIAVADATK